MADGIFIISQNSDPELRGILVDVGNADVQPLKLAYIYNQIVKNLVFLYSTVLEKK